MPLVLDTVAPHDFRATGISVLTTATAQRQEIAPVRLLLLDGDGGGESLTSLLALLSNTPLQVELAVELTPHSTAFDGVIVTADEPEKIPQNVPEAGASLLIGEAARLALAERHGITAEQLTRPLAEIIPHRICGDGSPLIAGQEPVVDVPVVRPWRIGIEAVSAKPALEILAHAPKAGVHLIYEAAIRRLYVLNQLSLTPLGFARRSRRQAVGGVDLALHAELPPFSWRTHAHLVFAAWLNAAVYQPSSLVARISSRSAS